MRTLDRSSGEHLTTIRLTNNQTIPSFKSSTTAFARGERIVNTPYKIGMNKNVECAVLCKNKKYYLCLISSHSHELKMIVVF